MDMVRFQQVNMAGVGSAVGNPLMPEPRRRSMVPEGVADFTPLYPPEFWPDEALNISRGGSSFILSPINFGVTLPASTQSNTRLNTDPTYAQYVIASYGTIAASTGGDIGVNDNRYIVDVKRRNMGLQDQVDGDWVAWQSVFGTAEYPYVFKMPMLLPPNSVFLFEFMNRTARNLTLKINWLAVRTLSQLADRA